MGKQFCCPTSGIYQESIRASIPQFLGSVFYFDLNYCITNYHKRYSSLELNSTSEQPMTRHQPPFPSSIMNPWWSQIIPSYDLSIIRSIIIQISTSLTIITCCLLHSDFRISESLHDQERKKPTTALTICDQLLLVVDNVIEDPWSASPPIQGWRILINDKYSTINLFFFSV